MRRLIVLAFGIGLLGWLVNSLRRTNERTMPSLIGQRYGKPVVYDDPRAGVQSDDSTAPHEDSPSEAAPSEEKDAPTPAEFLPDEQTDPLSGPWNVIPLEDSQRWNWQDSPTGDAPSGTVSQKVKARMKRARNGVDQRLRKLPEEGQPGKSDAA